MKWRRKMRAKEKMKDEVNREKENMTNEGNREKEKGGNKRRQ